LVDGTNKIQTHVCCGGTVGALAGRHLPTRSSWGHGMPLGATRHFELIDSARARFVHEDGGNDSLTSLSSAIVLRADTLRGGLDESDRGWRIAARRSRLPGQVRCALAFYHLSSRYVGSYVMSLPQTYLRSIAPHVQRYKRRQTSSRAMARSKGDAR
jgi:hypothetical protein